MGPIEHANSGRVASDLDRIIAWIISWGHLGKETNGNECDLLCALHVYGQSGSELNFKHESFLNK